MAAYPSYNMLLGSVKEQESGIIDDFATSGSQHSRVMYSQPYYRFRLLHQLSLAQFNSLKSTYNASPRADYTLTYLTESPVQTYTVKFTGPPQIVQNLALNRFLVEVPLRGTAD